MMKIKILNLSWYQSEPGCYKLKNFILQLHFSIICTILKVADTGSLNYLVQQFTVYNNKLTCNIPAILDVQSRGLSLSLNLKATAFKSQNTKLTQLHMCSSYRDTFFIALDSNYELSTLRLTLSCFLEKWFCLIYPCIRQEIKPDVFKIQPINPDLKPKQNR